MHVARKLNTSQPKELSLAKKADPYQGVLDAPDGAEQADEGC
jgi:hypothetical protein